MDRRPILRSLVLLFASLPFATVVAQESARDARPNVLFIAVDDLNHWLTHLGRNPQAQTPNFDRLARRGVTFTNAHTAVPACEPSRCALMSGRRPWQSGCYKNGHAWKKYQAAGEGLSAQFLASGYHVAGAGKIYHSMDSYQSEWSEYLSKSAFSSNGKGVEKMDGYHLDVTHPNLKDDDLMDWHTVDYCIERLENSSDKPFFIACGLYKPHLPFVVPRKYYEAFPLEEIQLPPHLEDDLDDLPSEGVKMANPKSDHAKFLKSGRWKAAIQSYLATCAYTDMNLGRLLDALDASPNRDNTIICLWSDHGWSFGEKQHWRKFALWEETTRVAYIWVVPGVTQPGGRCGRSVDLMSVYPTLCDLTDIEKPDHVGGHSIVSLLKDPNSAWAYPAITTHGRGNHSVKTETHRYIRYAGGGEELYEVTSDPYEWNNRASDPKLAGIKADLAKWLPTKEAPEPRKKKK
ncbi:MAG: sulfatase [Planctomycetota bacterium]